MDDTDQSTGERFVDRDLRRATFRSVDLRDATFRGVWFNGTVMRGVELVGVTIEGEVVDLVVNGVDVAPLVEAELDRRDPDRVMMRPTDAAGFRQAWVVLDQRWARTIARARTLDPDLLQESVDGEWSFTQTLRHLAFATETWLHRAILGDPRPWEPLALPSDEMDPHPEIPWDRDVRVPLDEVLALRHRHVEAVRAFLDDLDDERLDGHTDPVDGPGWPPADRYPVRECLLTILNEEWLHRQYAERDLDTLVGAD